MIDINFDDCCIQWIQQSNSPCQQSVQVCGFSAGMQDNWLITQLINRTVDGNRLPQASVMIEFEQRDCDVTLNCQRTFNTHVFETSSVDSAAARNLSNYRQVHRVSPDDTSGNRVNETVHINFNTEYSSFYFAIQDETSCIVVTRMIVFYSVCPMQTSDLIHHPETRAPRAPTSNAPGDPPIAVTVSCVDNAVTENDQPPLVLCSSGGLWSISGMGCLCRPGLGVNETGACSCELKCWKWPPTIRSIYCGRLLLLKE